MGNLHISFGTFTLKNTKLYIGFVKDKKPIGWGVKIDYVVNSF